MVCYPPTRRPCTKMWKHTYFLMHSELLFMFMIIFILQVGGMEVTDTTDVGTNDDKIINECVHQLIEQSFNRFNEAKVINSYVEMHCPTVANYATQKYGEYLDCMELKTKRQDPEFNTYNDTKFEAFSKNECLKFVLGEEKDQNKINPNSKSIIEQFNSHILSTIFQYLDVGKYAQLSITNKTMQKKINEYTENELNKTIKYWYETSMEVTTVDNQQDKKKRFFSIAMNLELYFKYVCKNMPAIYYNSLTNLVDPLRLSNRIWWSKTTGLYATDNEEQERVGEFPHNYPLYLCFEVIYNEWIREKYPELNSFFVIFGASFRKKDLSLDNGQVAIDLIYNDTKQKFELTNFMAYKHYSLVHTTKLFQVKTYAELCISK